MIIVVAHTKGGVGKSTIAWNIATALNSINNIEVIDLDFQRTLTYINEYRDNQLTVKSFDTLKAFEAYLKADNNQRISIVDVGGFDSEINRMAMVIADLIITPVSDANTELLGLMRFEKILKEISQAIGEEITVNILLNNINPQKKNLDELKEHINQNNSFTLFETILRTRADYGKALDDGLGIIEYKKESKGAAEMESLLKEINKIIKGNINE
jgi:chromosome partitioning protein